MRDCQVGVDETKFVEDFSGGVASYVEDVEESRVERDDMYIGG